MHINNPKKPKTDLGTNASDPAPLSAQGTSINTDAPRDAEMIKAAPETEYPYAEGDIVEGAALLRGTLIAGVREPAVVAIEGGRPKGIEVVSGKSYEICKHAYYTVLKLRPDPIVEAE